MIGRIANGGDGKQDVVIQGEDFLNDFTINWSLMEVPQTTITLPVKYGKYIRSASFVEIKDVDFKFEGYVTSKATNYSDGTVQLALAHSVGLLSRKVMPTNVTFKDKNLKEVMSSVLEYWKDAPQDIINRFKFSFNEEEVKSTKIEYEFSKETLLELLSKLCEKTEDFYWRVNRFDPREIEFSRFGEKKQVLVSPNNGMLSLDGITEDYSQVKNACVVMSDKADSGASSLTLRDIFEDKSKWIPGFPVIKTGAKGNSQRHFDYPPLPVFAPDISEEEYAVLDEEGIALEEGNVLWGTVTFNDTQAIAEDNKEVKDEDRISASEQLYRSAIRQMKASRRRIVYPVTTEPLKPHSVAVGDKVLFRLNLDIFELHPCSKYYEKVLRQDDWFYVTKITHLYSNGGYVMQLDLTKHIISDREV